MNIVKSDESPNSNHIEVRSKYFTNKTGMDESLSDFQEKKKNSSGPKTTKVTKSKPQKQIKKIKGQKDIRTVLKSKRNELVAYANDFDKICKQSGLDIDSEQLQIAIALSKSLQRNENLEENTPQSSKSLNSQERIGKIRTTLQEYGFKVPEIKITEAKRRKLKRSRNTYKLLLSTDNEKQEIISERYSQVLIQNLDCVKQVENTAGNTPFGFKIATGSAYEEIRDNTTFYVEGLIDKSPNSVGCLLRDWSEIPGRPLSPKLELSKLHFSNISCNQEELDCVLSGSLKVAQDLVKNKYCFFVINHKAVNIVKDSPKISQDSCTRSHILEEEKRINLVKMDVEITNIDCEKQSTNEQYNLQKGKVESGIEVKDYNASTLAPTLNTRPVRCCSPDIFDDEVSTIMENNCSNKIVISQESHKDTTDLNVDVLDFTECVSSQKHLILEDASLKKISNFQLSQDRTRRMSNDLMELTSIIGSSQPFRLNTIEENIDLTQNSDESGLIVLTQSSDSNDDLPFVEIPGTQASSSIVILEEEAFSEIDKNTSDSSPVNDYLDNNLKVNEEMSTNIVAGQVTLHTNHVQTASSKNLNSSKTTNSLDVIPSVSQQFVINNEIHSITLNSSSDTVENESGCTEAPLKANIGEDCHQSNSQSFFEEYIHPHSDEARKETEDLNIDVNHEAPTNSITIVEKCTDNDANIDLTQSSDNSVPAILSDEESKTPNILSFSSLGKKENVSIDYDELFDASKNSTISYFKDLLSLKYENASKSVLCGVVDAVFPNTASTEKYTKESDLSSSQTSEVFEINDQELDYSMHKSRLEIDSTCGNFDFGGISVVDNHPDLPSIGQSRNHEQMHNSLNQAENDNFLFHTKGDINKEGPKITHSDIETVTPFKKNINQVVNIETPTNNEYIIKTDQVTPMLNYDSMTTPERNRELDKYGLKPFKRKRAIQLLKHIYNQTHPILEACTSDGIHPSPKKAKYNIERNPGASLAQNQKSSRKNHKSPKKCIDLQNTQKSPVKNKSPRKLTEEINKENDIYQETNSPVIRDIQCLEEDWVFQKREKAKVYSCRVPLHIAFHNYVSSRRSLREAILRYEPVNIDDIHKGMSASGHKYDPKDLLKFMDKKCITVKTADGAKNKKHY